jgi:hypothetical protein
MKKTQIITISLLLVKLKLNSNEVLFKKCVNFSGNRPGV